MSIAPPPGPSATSTARTGGDRAGAAERGASEAFGSAMEDALAGSSGPATPGTGKPADDVAADESPADDAAAPAPVAELPPGLWALLAGVLTPPVTPPAGTGDPLAGELPATTGTTPTGPGAIAAVLGGVPGVPAAPDVPAAAGPAAVAVAATPPAPAAAPPGQPSAGSVQGAATAAEAFAQITGLTVVAAPADGPAAVPTLSPTGAGAADPVAAPHTPGPGPVGTDTAATDDSGTNGSGTGSGAGTPAPAALDSGPAPLDELPTGVPGAAPLPGPSATPAAAAATPAGRETPVAAQLAPQLAVLRNAPDGSQTMTVVLTPDALGEVTVQVTITDGTLDLMLRGGSEHGRHALADALPELRRELESAGLSLSRLAVDPDAPRDGGPGGRTAEQLMADLRGNGGQQQGSPSQRSRAWHAADTSPGEAPAPALRPSASSGVDVRV